MTISYTPVGWVRPIELTVAHLGLLADIVAGRPTNVGVYDHGVCERPYYLAQDLEQGGLIEWGWHPEHGDCLAATAPGRAVHGMVTDHPDTVSIRWFCGALSRIGGSPEPVEAAEAASR
jgi:hypothetical protein